MGRWVLRSLLGLVIVLVLVQFIPVDRANPEFSNKKTITAKETVPPSIKTVFSRSCGDCHSDQTTWPWYSYVAPVSWIISSDVHNGRKHVNFSEWGDYSAKQREEALENICEQVQQSQMPEKTYLLLHPDARLRQADRDAVCRWTEAARQY
jgi:Haem-binding domain